MEAWFSSHISGTKVITPKDRGTTKMNAKFKKDGLDPNGFRCDICQGFVLDFSAGTRDCGLFTSTLGNQIRTKKHGEPSDRATIIGIASPISIRNNTKEQR
jgi:hypothetical protein